MPFQFGDLDPSSAEFFLQEERLAQMRSEYERQCRVSGDPAPVCAENTLTANSSPEQRYNAAGVFFVGFFLFFLCNVFFPLTQVLAGRKLLPQRQSAKL